MQKENSNIKSTNIVSEMQESYLDYAMSVIVSRALPDIRDGLKPVHRRILYAMKEMGLTHNAKLRKSATVVGEVMGKYHPHGNDPIYETLVRMAQDFSFRYPLVIGQGNFGSIDGDSPAAMRYTEAKMSAISEMLINDIEKNTVDFVPNYDGTRKEPTLLPAAFPHLLVNGSLGIAVGMATTIPPHNLTEVINGTIHLIENPKATSQDLTQYIQGPDFPTGGIIYNTKDISEAYKTGRGGVVTRGEADIIEKKGGYQIVITSLPYQVNKAELVNKMATLVQEKKLDCIRDIRDESDRQGLRIAIDLKTDSYPQKTLNYLYKHTDLEKTIHFNVLELVDGIQPKTLSLKDILEEFIKARINVVERRTRFDLDVAKKRVHILEGLSKALTYIEQIIQLIKSSKDREDAHTNLKKRYAFTDEQATAILDMRLQTLAGLERKKIETELKEKRALVKELEALLKSPQKIRTLIKKELAELREKFGDERKTKIINTAAKTISLEDTIPEEEHIMILTTSGYLKRVRPQAYRTQKRGGKGVTGANDTEDMILEFVSASTHDDLLFFSTKGKVYQTKMYEIPESSRTAKGKSAVNFLALSAGEAITSVLVLPKKHKGAGAALVMATKKGIIKKVRSELFSDVRRSGIIAVSLKKNDSLRWARLVELKDTIMLFPKNGLAIRFPEPGLRFMSRTAKGVKGIQLKGEDIVVDCEIVPSDKQECAVFVISENGFGKKTPVKEFKIQHRGGTGVKAINITQKTGKLVNASIVTGDEEFIAMSEKGKTIRSVIKEIPRLTRTTQGVRVMKLETGDHIASMTLL